MDSITKDTDLLQCSVSSQLENVDRIIEEMKLFLSDMNAGNTAQLVQVVRELALNGIEHGNEGDVAKKITLEIIKIAERRIKISVGDEGEGLPADLFPITHEIKVTDKRTRGLVLVNSLVDELTYSDTEQCVIAYCNLTSKFSWGIQQTEEELYIEPSIDISATVLDAFRKILFDWLDGEVPHCNLNLKNVASLDSVTLSLMIAFSEHLGTYNKREQFVITGVSEELMVLFNMTQMGRLFTIKG